MELRPKAGLTSGLERIHDIRSSEQRFYQKVLDTATKEARAARKMKKSADMSP